MHSDICWQCKKNHATQWNGRCYDCQLNKCVHCNEKLTKIVKKLDFDATSNTPEYICTNKSCFSKISLAKITDTWTLHE